MLLKVCILVMAGDEAIGEECFIVIAEQKNNDRLDNNIPARLLLLGNEVE